MDENSKATHIVQMSAKINKESIIKFTYIIETYPTIQDIRTHSEEEVSELLQEFINILTKDDFLGWINVVSILHSLASSDSNSPNGRMRQEK